MYQTLDNRQIRAVLCVWSWHSPYANITQGDSKQNGCYFAHGIFKCILKRYFFNFRLSPKVKFNLNLAMVMAMVRHPTDDKLSTYPIMTQFTDVDMRHQTIIRYNYISTRYSLHRGSSRITLSPCGPRAREALCQYRLPMGSIKVATRQL